jgi:putative acetyltransferase
MRLQYRSKSHQWGEIMHIIIDDLSGPEIRALLETHFAGMLASSPPGSCHFLDFDGLNAADVTFWSIWTDAGKDAYLMGCGALKELSVQHGEIKSMRTAAAYLGKGVGTHVLRHIITEAKVRGITRLSLETGSSPDFDAAHALYRNHGFAYCGPFGDYVVDPFSRYMTLEI